MSAPRAVVFGVSGVTLTADERAFLTEADPLGFILFARNCEAPDQVRTLTGELREAVGRVDAPVLIDQEGGTVMRLRPPNWHDAPDAERLGNLYPRDPERARAAARAVGALFGAELRDIGVDVDCAPVADLGLPETTGAIGTRAYSRKPVIVADLARAMGEGLMQEGCLPVLKHLPGHGRATVDSHRALPRVDAAPDTLRESDFAAFRALRDLPLGMVAHVVFAAFDAENAASVSSTIIDDVIRDEIGFDGFLFSDDIVMAALQGRHSERAAAALAAG
ncbi:MAG: beta-N-acetylhexosaminidase, partial [Alphaproteobacteria bacterium]|nr:beta-N-acetylhexosaminidase [Alphaproteobacteria bacterium]